MIDPLPIYRIGPTINGPFVCAAAPDFVDFPDRWSYAISFYAIVDLLAIAPFWIGGMYWHCK
jgi:hypothetical protein